MLQPVVFSPGNNLVDLIDVTTELFALGEYKQAANYLKKAKPVIRTMKKADLLGVFFDKSSNNDGRSGRSSAPSLLPQIVPVADKSGKKIHQYKIYNPDIAFKGFLESVLLNDCSGLIAYTDNSPKLVRSALRARLDRIIGIIEVFSTPKEIPYSIDRINKIMSLVPAQVLALLGDIRIFIMPCEFTNTPAQYISLPMATSAWDTVSSGPPQPNCKLGIYMLGIPNNPETIPEQVLLHEIGFGYLDALSPERNIPLQLRSFLAAIVGEERFNALDQQELIADFSHFFAYTISSYDPSLTASNAYHNMPGFSLHGKTLIRMYEEFFSLSPQQIKLFGELFFKTNC